MRATGRLPLTNIMAFQLMKKILLARQTFLGLIILTLLALSLANFIPQRSLASDLQFSQFQEQHRFWWPLIYRAGLDHIYSTSWFIILITLILVSLSISLISQLQGAGQQTFSRQSRGYPGKSSRTDLQLSELRRILQRRFYFCLFQDQIQARFVKHPWGYWGNALLHLGLLISVAGSLYLAATFQSGRLYLYEGESTVMNEAWPQAQAGLLADQPRLPVSITLELLWWQFWEDYSLKDLQSIITVGDDLNHRTRELLRVNKPFLYKDWRVSQGNNIGHAFFLEIWPAAGEKKMIVLQIDHPRAKERASYTNFGVDGLLDDFKAKYTIDEFGGSDHNQPLLVVRLADPAQSEPVALQRGELGKIGNTLIRYLDHRRWVTIQFARYQGVSAVFSGFLLVILGSATVYLFPPRELTAVNDNGTVKCRWKAARFAGCFQAEYQELLLAMQAKE